MRKQDRERDTRNPALPIWAKRINSLLMEKGMQQYELAEMSGVAKSTISGWLHEEGKGSVEPKIKGFADTAKALGVSVDFLMGNQQCKTPKKEGIYKATGLSDKAQTSLKTVQRKIARGDNEAANKLAALNCLIEVINDTALFDSLYNYLLMEFQFTHNPEQKKSAKIVQKSVDGTEKETIILSDMLRQAYLGAVQEDLVRVKDLVVKQQHQLEKAEYEHWEKLHKVQPHDELTDTTEADKEGE